MARFFARRLLLVAPLLVLVTVLVFGMVQLVPGDPAATLAGEGASQEQIAATRHDLGLDRSVVRQYSHWVVNAVRGDLGKSLLTKEQVTGLITSRLPITASLALLTLVIAVLAAFGAGAIGALFPNSMLDRAVTVFAGLALAVPPFVVGIALVAFLSVRNRVFPALGYVPLGDGVGEWLRHLVLPALAVSLIPASELARHTRGAMVDAMEQDLIRTVRARGLSRWSVVAKHAAKNAALPVVTVLGIVTTRVLAGVVTVEFVFALPGFGQLAFNAVQNRDIPVVQGVVLVSALVVIVTNLLVDASYVYFDPRSRR